MTLNEDIQKILEEDVKTKTKNPGILEVPEGKNFWDLPLKHYKELVDKKGYAKVIRALTNLEVWNKNDDPDISKKATKIADDLKKFYKKESKERVLLTALEDKINKYKDYLITLSNVPTDTQEMINWLLAFDEVAYFIKKIDRVKDAISEVDFEDINDEYIEYVNLKIDQAF